MLGGAVVSKENRKVWMGREGGTNEEVIASFTRSSVVGRPRLVVDTLLGARERLVLAKRFPSEQNESQARAS